MPIDYADLHLDDYDKSRETFAHQPFRLIFFAASLWYSDS